MNPGISAKIYTACVLALVTSRCIIIAIMQLASKMAQCKRTALASKRTELLTTSENLKVSAKSVQKLLPCSLEIFGEQLTALLSKAYTLCSKRVGNLMTRMSRNRLYDIACLPNERVVE